MSMPTITLLTGGARSGKSRHALELATSHPSPLALVATAQALDDEMRERIAAHQAERGEGWLTVEAPRDLASALRRLQGRASVAVVDCLTVWLSNLLHHPAPGEEAGNDAGVTSTVLDGQYGVLQGTSMAAPAVSGAIALVVEDYRRIFNGVDPLPSAVRALLLHSARDLEDETPWINRGPDYASGYGRLDATDDEVIALFKDLLQVNCRLLTIGQYLRPNPDCLPVHEYVTPEHFDVLKAQALDLGFAGVSSGPFVRSSHHAHELFAETVDAAQS